MQNALKVGSLVVLFAVLLVGAYALLGKSMFAPKTQGYYALFPDAGGLTPGAKVLMAGVTVGQVSSLRLATTRLARVELQINDGIRIPRGSQAILPTSFIGVGDRQVEIITGDASAGYLAVGDSMPGALRSPLAGLLPNTQGAIDELTKTLVSVRAIVEDKTLKQQLGQLMASFKQTSDRYAKLADSMDGLIASNRGTLEGTLKKGALVLDDIQRTSRAIAQIASSGKYEKKLDALFTGLDKAVASGNELLIEFRAFVNDPKLREPLQAIVENTRVVSETGTRIATNAEVMSKNGVTISEKAIELVDRANRLAADAQELLGRLKGTIGKLPTGGTKFGLGAIGYEATLSRESRPARIRADVLASIRIGSNTVNVGLWDAFERNRLIAQIGRPLGPDGVIRYGIYASKPGIGVSYPVSPRLSMRGDLFGLNDARFDFRAQYDFGRGLFGYAGVDRVFDGNAFSMGVGVRR